MERFWSKVNKDGPVVREELGPCWVWTSVTHRDYGYFRIGNKYRRAHRVAWELAFGPIPRLDGVPYTVVRHKCDNPPCVNPNHLETGTQSDNIQDIDNRGRRAQRTAAIAVGEKHGHAKLSESDIQKIFELKAKGAMSQRDIAKLLGISEANVSRVVNRKIWKHI